MACSICDHTIQFVGILNIYPTYWCSRCGAISNQSFEPNTTVPKLIDNFVGNMNELISLLSGLEEH